MWLHMFFRLYFPWQWVHSSLQLLIQPWNCTTYPLWSLPDTSTYDKHWESNPNLSDLESNAPSTWPHTPTSMRLYLNIGAPEVNCNIFNIGAPSIFVYFSNAEFRLLAHRPKNTTIGLRLYNPIISLRDPDYLFPEVMQYGLRSTEWKNIYVNTGRLSMSWSAIPLRW